MFCIFLFFLVFTSVFSSQEGPSVYLTVENPHDFWVKIPRYTSGFESHCPRCFEVKVDGVQLDYRGVYLLRQIPKDDCDQFIYISPRSTLTKQLYVAKYFHLKPGNVTIQWHATIPRTDGSLSGQISSSPSLRRTTYQVGDNPFDRNLTNTPLCENIPTLEITCSNLFRFENEFDYETQVKLPQRPSGDPKQYFTLEEINSIINAQQIATTLLKKGEEEMQKSKSLCRRTWLTATDSLKEKGFVEYFFDNATKPDSITYFPPLKEFSPTCFTDPGTIAYVDPSKRDGIHLCDKWFMSQPAWGFQGRGSTMVHEMLHFMGLIMNNATTPPEEYTKIGCLRRVRERTAYMNPCNYEFFLNCLGYDSIVIKTVHGKAFAATDKGYIYPTSDEKDSLKFVCEGEWPQCNLRVKDRADSYLDFDWWDGELKLSSSNDQDFTFELYRPNVYYLKYPDNTKAVYRVESIKKSSWWNNDAPGFTYFEVEIDGISQLQLPITIQSLSSSAWLSLNPREGLLTLKPEEDDAMKIQRVGPPGQCVLRSSYLDEIIFIDYDRKNDRKLIFSRTPTLWDLTFKDYEFEGMNNGDIGANDVWFNNEWNVYNKDGVIWLEADSILGAKFRTKYQRPLVPKQIEDL
jgi:hypothetical protein